MSVEDLMNQPGTPYFKTDLGAAYWGDSRDLLAHVPDKAVNLILTSPPFALTRKKEYGNESAEDYVE